MDERYLTPMSGGRWAVSRKVAGNTMYLVQNAKVDNESDIALILQALDIENTKKNIDTYFPFIEGEGRCPTLDLMEIFSRIDRTYRNPKNEVGV